MVRGLIGQRLDYIAAQLPGRSYLMGETFTVPDAYLFTILRWGKWTGIDISRWPGLEAYTERIAGRPAVLAALAAEHLPKQ